jgi:uncharacterized protein YukE
MCVTQTALDVEGNVVAQQGGFDYNPEAVRGFAAVFAEAKAQVDQVKATLAQTSAKAADFGKSWATEGGNFERYMQMLADDLTNLATHLGEIDANLNKGTDLVVNADSSGFSNLRSIEDRMGDDAPRGTGGR